MYWAVDQDGQIIGVLVSACRDADAARRLFRRALSMLKVKPREVATTPPRSIPPSWTS